MILREDKTLSDTEASLHSFPLNPPRRFRPLFK